MTDPCGLVRRAGAVLDRDLQLQRSLPGGQHALTVLVHDGERELVVRGFPAGDTAVEREVTVLPRLAPLGRLVPQLVAYSCAPDSPLIITTRAPGGHPGPDLSPLDLASPLGRALAQIHALPCAGEADLTPPDGTGRVSRLVRENWDTLASEPSVLTHFDFWCGNALWTGPTLTGVIDWPSARPAPRGVDVAWCRQDLLLLGSHRAATAFTEAYERAAEVRVEHLRLWDLNAAARAFDAVESWAPNYVGIGRPLESSVLRQRLDTWTASLLD